MASVQAPKFSLASAIVVAAFQLHSQAHGATMRAEATAVIREGVAVRSPRKDEIPKPDDAQPRTRTVTRPCDPANPAILCKLVLIEMP